MSLISNICRRYSTRLYVGGLPFTFDAQLLQQKFSQYGTVEEAVIVSDKFTGRSRGFGFVQLKEDEAAENAIAELHNNVIEGRRWVVNVALVPKTEKMA